MDTLLRKYLWAVDLVVITLVAVFAARATATAIEAKYLLGAGTARTAARGVSHTGPKSYGKDPEEILKRNVFCSTCPPLITPPAKPDAGDQGPSEAPPVKTALPLKLLAVMYSPPPSDPRWSVAVIQDTDSKGMGPYSVGMQVHGATITSIDEMKATYRVYLRNGSQNEYLDLFEPPAPPKVAANTPAPTDPNDKLSAEIDKGLKKLGDNKFEIQRGTLDAVLGNMTELSRSARIVPEVKDGKPAGFRLYSVRPDGPFAKIGLQNGDVIYAINGLDMTSPENALTVYTKLRSASHLAVNIERNAQKINMDYSIR